MLSKQEWEEWRAQHQTKVFFRHLKQRYEDAKQDWADGAFDGSSAEEFALRQVQALAGVRVLSEIIETDYEDLDSDGNESIGDLSP